MDDKTKFEMDAICINCGQRYGDHTGVNCPPPYETAFELKIEREKMSKKNRAIKVLAWTKAIAEVLLPVLMCVLLLIFIIKFY